jgi:DNA-binding NtrC family response regulator
LYSKRRPNISDRVMDTLLAYDWPGNVRELQNVLYRLVTLKRLDLTGATKPDPAPPRPSAEPEAPLPHPLDSTLPEATALFEKQLITASLTRCRWNRTHTARSLGIGLRTLQRKMKTLGIH